MKYYLVLFLLTGCLLEAAPEYLVKNGRPEAAIVVGSRATPFYRTIAEQLQHYITALSGVRLEIVEEAPAQQSPVALWLLVGGPQSHGIVGEAAKQGLVQFSGLKPDGFLLWRTRIRGHEALIAGGNDEASTMYAVYDLVERLGVTFLLHKDLLPPKSQDLLLPDLQARVESPFPRRGLLISNIYPSRGIWHLSEVKSFLDQMAKLKMNYLQFFWFEHEPWINFGFRGENKLLGDATGKETGYMGWRYHYGSYLVDDLPVGRNLFGGRKRIAPGEFQNVETPEDAFRVSKDFLTEIIRYAKTRKIKVWLCVDPTTLPGNLARFSTRATNYQIPFHPILGTHMCPADPELHEMNENRLRALAETYPEAEGYFLYIPEMFPDCPDELNRQFLLAQRPNYEGLTKLWQAYTGYERNPKVVLDSNAGSIHILKKMIESRDRVAPQARLGIGGIGRGFVLPFLDKVFPKNIPFTDMESRAIWTAKGVPMEYFGGMGERERTLIPRLDDDSAMFAPQFSVNLYYKDRALEGSLENGVAGFAGQLNRVRGTEQNYRYLAEGAWNPHLKPDEFYREYARRIYGEAAQAEMREAFRLLEQNEEYLGWTGKGNFGCCGVPGEVSLARGLYKQPNPFDGPADWKRFVSGSRELVPFYEKSIENLKTVLSHLDKAAATVAPQGSQELRFLRNKTESYILLFTTWIAVRRAYVEFDEAFRLRKQLNRAEFVRRLDRSMERFTEARQLGRRTTEKFAEFVDHPSDMGVLYRANLFLVTGLELVEQTMRNIVNFHHGRHYAEPVAWNKIYHDFPQFSPAW